MISPYESNPSAEVGERLFEYIQMLIDPEIKNLGSGFQKLEKGPSDEAIEVFGEEQANIILKTARRISFSGMLYGCTWTDGIIAGSRCGRLEKELLLLCLCDYRFARSISSELMIVVKDLGIFKIVSDALSLWKLEGKYPCLARCDTVYKFKKQARCFKSLLFIARAVTCMKYLQWDFLAISDDTSLKTKIFECCGILESLVTVDCMYEKKKVLPQKRTIRKTAPVSGVTTSETKNVPKKRPIQKVAPVAGVGILGSHSVEKYYRMNSHLSSHAPSQKEKEVVLSMCRGNQWDSVLNSIRSNRLIATTNMTMKNKISTTILHQAITSKGDISKRARVIQEILDIAPLAAFIKNGYDSLPIHAIAQRNNRMDSKTKETLISTLVNIYPKSLTHQGGALMRTPLHIIFADYISPKILAIMIRYGRLACFMPDKKGRLPVHVACSRHCSPQKLAMLLEVNPASLFAKTNDGKTILDLAKSTTRKRHPNRDLIQDIERRMSVLSHTKTNVERNDDGCTSASVPKSDSRINCRPLHANTESSGPKNKTTAFSHSLSATANTHVSGLTIVSPNDDPVLMHANIQSSGLKKKTMEFSHVLFAKESTLGSSSKSVTPNSDGRNSGPMHSITEFSEPKTTTMAFSHSLFATKNNQGSSSTHVPPNNYGTNPGPMHANGESSGTRKKARTFSHTLFDTTKKCSPKTDERNFVDVPRNFVLATKNNLSSCVSDGSSMYSGSGDPNFWYPVDPEELLLNPLQIETAWLIEESAYCTRSTNIDWIFVMKYASPALQIKLRQIPDVDGTNDEESLATLLHNGIEAKRFVILRREIKRKLLKSVVRTRMQGILPRLRIATHPLRLKKIAALKAAAAAKSTS